MNVYFKCRMFIFCILVVQNTVYATRYYVDPSISDSSDGSGSTWLNALNTLDLALTVATNQTDEIWLRGGFAYIPSNPIDRTDCFITPNGLSIYGGFDGKWGWTNGVGQMGPGQMGPYTNMGLAKWVLEHFLTQVLLSCPRIVY
eukprot:459063_1